MKYDNAYSDNTIFIYVGPNQPFTMAQFEGHSSFSPEKRLLQEYRKRRAKSAKK